MGNPDIPSPNEFLVQDQLKAATMAEAEKPFRANADMLKRQAEKMDNTDQAELARSLAEENIKLALEKAESQGIEYDEQMKKGLQKILLKATSSLASPETPLDSSLMDELIVKLNGARTLNELYSSLESIKAETIDFGRSYYKDADIPGGSSAEAEAHYSQFVEQAIGTSEKPLVEFSLIGKDGEAIKGGFYRTALNSGDKSAIVWGCRDKDNNVAKGTGDFMTFASRGLIDQLEIETLRDRIG